MNEKCKSLSSNAIQVKNQQKAISIEDKLDVISRLENVEQIVGICQMLDSLIIAYVQFVIMVIELTKVISQELKHLCSKTTKALLEWTVPEVMDVNLVRFYCIIDK